MLGWLPISYSVLAPTSISRWGSHFITSQGPLKECPTSANFTTSCQQTTEGDSLYLHTSVHAKRTKWQKLWTLNQVDSPHGSTVLLSCIPIFINCLNQLSSPSNDKKRQARWGRDIWDFEGHNRNEVEYEMHQVKWWYTCTFMLAAAKGVHLDAEWHLHTPARLFYGCFSFLQQRQAVAIASIRFLWLSTGPSYFYDRFQSKSSQSPSILASRDSSLLSSPTSDCCGWWKNMKFQYSSKLPSQFAETEWYNRAHR